MPKILLLGGTEATVGGLERYCERFLDALGGEPGVSVSWQTVQTSVGCRGWWRGLADIIGVCGGLKRALRELDPRSDVVWFQYGNGLDMLVLGFLRYTYRGRVLCTVHVGKQWKHVRSRCGQRAMARVLRSVDLVCVLSEAQRQWMSGLGVGRLTKVLTLLPGWVSAVPPRPKDRRQGCLFVGRLIEEKGIADLIEAVGYAKRLGESCTLDIVGSGIRSFTVKMQQLVERLGLRQQVTFHGPKEEPEVLEFMLTRRLFVYPSYADAYPLGLLESIAAGMYPIAYGIPGTSEIVAEYGGCLVRKGDVEGLARAVVSGLRRDDPACSWRVRQRLDPRCVAREYRQLAFQ